MTRATMPMLVAAAALLLLAFGMPTLAPLIAREFPDVVPPIYGLDSFPRLLLSHALVVATASLAATAAALALGIFVTRPAGLPFRTMVGAVASIGQTLPPVAVLAIAVPTLGYGARPTIVALMLYGLLPIVANVIAGIETVPASVREAAEGMGMSPGQILWRVELPLAAPVILAGIRVSVVIAIGTAAIGSTVGAVTLGTPIIDGLVGDKLPYVIEGAAVTGLFAITADLAFEWLDRRLRARSGY